MRGRVLEEFWRLSSHELQKKYLLNGRKLSVAVLGGYENEPEIELLREHFSDVDLTVVGISGESHVYLDLNSQEQVKGLEFDLVLCSQVIEHIWNHKTFFYHLGTLTGPKGLVWLAAPASNFEHGFPSYYSSGFSHTFLAQNLSENGFVVLSSGGLASRRSYLMRHVFLHWISAEQAQKPSIFFFRYFFRTNWRQKVATALTLMIPESSKRVYTVESYAFAQRV